MDFPLACIIAIISLGLLLFILYFVYRYSESFSRKLFRTLAGIITVAVVAIFSFVLYLNRPPSDFTRVAIFPFIDHNKNDNDDWSAWAIADISTQLAKSQEKKDILFYPLEWLWESINKDSVTDLNYLNSYSSRINLDYFIVGDFDSECSECPINWSMVAVKKGDIIASGKIKYLPHEIYPASTQLVSELYTGLELKFKSPDISPIPDFILEKFIRSKKAYLERKFDQSIQILEQINPADSNFVPVRNLLASAHLQYGLYLKTQGKPEGAHYAIARVISQGTLREDSLNSTAERLLGEYFLYREFWSKAEDHFRKALDITPKDAILYRNLAQLHSSRFKDLGFHNEKDILNYAIFLDPCYEDARIQLAKFYYFKRWPSRAEKEVHKLLAINPNSLEGLLYLSKLYVSQNEIMKLLETSKKAVELYPNNADAYFNLGIAYYHWQDFKNARIFFQRAVDLNDYVDAHLYLAYIDNYEGDVQNAIKELRHRLLLRRDDLYANKARELLYQLTHSDSTDVVNGHSAQITSNSDSSRIEVGVSQTRF